jgi:IclR family acetate operon transcriptional repressor
MYPVTRMETRQTEDGSARGAGRVLSVFKALAAYPRGATLEQLAERLESPKSSVHRALATLRRAGLAEQDRDGRYRFGMEALRLAFAYYEGLDQRVLVQPALDALVDAFGETAHYAQLDRGEVVYVAKVMRHDHDGIRLGSRVGGRNPAHCTGVGKALLAGRLGAAADDAAFLAALGPLEARTAKTLAEPGRLLADLRATAERGYALDDEESELGINCIAFPLYRASPAVPSGAISVAALSHRVPLDALARDAEAMREVIHRHLGRVTR